MKKLFANEMMLAVITALILLELSYLISYLTIDIPLGNSTKELTYVTIFFILLDFSLFILYYIFYMKHTNKSLQKHFTNKDKLLSEYKKAVDFGAIVSKADTKGIITYVNESFCEVSGYSKEELIGKPHSIVRHPDNDKKLFKKMWEKISNKEVWQGDIKNLAKDKRPYYVYATIVPIVDENNEIVEYLALRYDTTKLHQAIKKANNAEKIKGRFLANMSHELRTPLNAIIGFSQILLKRNTLSDKDALYVQKIGLSGENLLTLVNSILDFSKIEEGEMEFHPSDINIKELFEDILVMFETTIKEKNITLVMFKYDEDKTLYADKQLLKQSLTNILSNALKFTPANGEIRLTCKEENSTHIFSICDTGEGISKEDIKILFEPFKQGESAHKNATKGTGLGLAITKQIITDLHHGKIWVESEIGKGTCFYIAL